MLDRTPVIGLTQRNSLFRPNEKKITLLYEQEKLDSKLHSVIDWTMSMVHQSDYTQHLRILNVIYIFDCGEYRKKL